jgi:hypothetical protein
VYSPLVFAVWKHYADAFIQKYQKIDWDTLHSALLLPDGWADFGLSRGSINLGQTRPNTSNSGLLSIMLMTYAFYKSGQNLKPEMINSPSLWNYINAFETAVNEFGLSSGTYFSETIIGNPPSAHAITLTYENLVLLNQGILKQQEKEPLLIFYPGLNAISNHPFAILDAPWVTSEQKQAAQQFRDFLLEPKQQLQALQYGFRSNDPAINLTDAGISNNPFTQLSQLAPRSTFDYNNQAHVPSGAAVDALISQWTIHYPNP